MQPTLLGTKNDVLGASPSLSRIGALTYFLAFAVAFGIIAIPFFLSSPLPLVDYPNHLARMYIIANLKHSADLAQYYSLDWSYVPNLAMDLIVPWLIGPLSAESASWLFVLSIQFLIASGVIVLNRTLYGKWTFTPFLCFLLLFNRSFLWGFLNYLFTVGLSFWLMAAHVHFRKRGYPPLRIVLFSLGSVVLMTCHLHAFASYAIMVGCFELSIAWRTRRETGTMPWADLVIPGLQFIPPLVLFLLSRTANRVGETIYFGLKGKVQGLVDVFNNYNLPLDIATFLVLALLLTAGLFARRVQVHRDMRLCLVLLFIIYWLMPDAILGSYFADRRLIVFVAILLVACMDLRLEKMRARTAMVGMLVALFLVRMGLIAYNWHEANKVFAPILSLMDKVPEGSRVLALIGGDIEPSIQNPPLEHLPNMLVVKKNVYINSLFGEPGQQPLQVITGARTEFSITPSQNYRVKAQRLGTVNPYPNVPWERFDYMLMLNPISFVKEVPSYLKPMGQAGMARLYRVDLPYRPPYRPQR